MIVRCMQDAQDPCLHSCLLFCFDNTLIPKHWTPKSHILIMMARYQSFLRILVVMLLLVDESMGQSPSSAPSALPSARPSTLPTKAPIPAPTGQPSKSPSSRPSLRPSAGPTAKPISGSPSRRPSRTPSRRPSSKPSRVPSSKPSRQPTASPSQSQVPSLLPSTSPSAFVTNIAGALKFGARAAKECCPITIPTLQYRCLRAAQNIFIGRGQRRNYWQGSRSRQEFLAAYNEEQARVCAEMNALT